MGGLNSHTQDNTDLIEYCLGLTLNLLYDVLQQAGLDTTRDAETILRRTNAEGLGFLTKTLPSFGKAIQQSLLGKQLLTTQFRLQRGSALPHFMKGLLSRVFSKDGYVLENADICAIKDLLQLCLIWYKLEVPYHERQENAVIKKFINNDNRLPNDFSHLGSCTTRLEPLVLAEARTLIHGLLAKFNPCNIIPSHGPGALATGEKPHEKFQFRRLYDSVEEMYPFNDYFRLSEKHVFDDWDQYWDLSHETNPTSRVMLVPKDSRGPRLISAEPLEIQFIQQGLGKALVNHIERNYLTRGHVNFTDQNVNRTLAMQGSLDSSWDTLDMSDASDLVSLALVRALFEGTSIYKYLLATRSTHTKLPDGQVRELRKFAPMGSALCFPVEALCFWALGVACLHVHGNLSLNRARESIYVYGDDIIVRGGYSSYLLSNFQYYGLKFNRSKCCYTGHFRESCGCDAYKGSDVTIIKVKKLPPQQSTDGQGYSSMLAYANSFFQSCYYRTAEYITKRVCAIWGDLPFSGRDPHRIFDDDSQTINGFDSPRGTVTIDSAPCLYVRTPCGATQLYRKSRYNRNLQRTEFFVLTVTPCSYNSYESSCWSELFRHIISGLGTAPYLYALRRRVRLKRRWVCLSH